MLHVGMDIIKLLKCYWLLVPPQKFHPNMVGHLCLLHVSMDFIKLLKCYWLLVPPQKFHPNMVGHLCLLHVSMDIIKLLKSYWLPVPTKKLQKMMARPPYLLRAKQEIIKSSKSYYDMELIQRPKMPSDSHCCGMHVCARTMWLSFECYYLLVPAFIVIIKQVVPYYKIQRFIKNIEIFCMNTIAISHCFIYYGHCIREMISLTARGCAFCFKVLIRILWTH